MNKLPLSLSRVLLKGLTQMKPHDLDLLARRDGSMIDYIADQVHLSIPSARRLVSRRDKDQLRALSAQDFDDLLDDLLQQCPDQATVLFSHKKWYIRQMVQLQRVLTA